MIASISRSLREAQDAAQLVDVSFADSQAPDNSGSAAEQLYKSSRVSSFTSHLFRITSQKLKDAKARLMYNKLNDDSDIGDEVLIRYKILLNL